MSLYEKSDGGVSVSGLNDELSWIITRSNRTKNNTRHMELSALSPYTLYGISVSAVNVMSDVELQGNETKLLNFSTKDEGKIQSHFKFCSTGFMYFLLQLLQLHQLVLWIIIILLPFTLSGSHLRLLTTKLPFML